MAALRENYEIALDTNATQYIGINLDWNYAKRTLRCSIPGYVKEALEEFMHELPKFLCYAPSKAAQRIYGQRMQFAHIDESDKLTDKEIKYIQKVTGKFLYYARAVDPTMLHALNDIATKTIKGTKETLEDVNYFLNYCACNQDAAALYRASDMLLRIDSDAAYLVAPRARSRAGGFHYLSNKEGTLFNGAIYNLVKVLKHVCASAAEAEIGALYANAREATIFRNTLEDMGHPQPPTPIKTDNTTANGILDDSMEAKYLKGADMRVNWLKDRVEQNQFEVYWEPAITNLGDYHTKRHGPAHHRTVRPIYTHQYGKSPETLQGCVNILREEELAKQRRQSPAAKPAGEERQPPAIKKLARVQPLSKPLKPRQTRVRAIVEPPQAHTSATLEQSRISPIVL